MNRLTPRSLCVISSVLLLFIWPNPQESNTFTGHSTSTSCTRHGTRHAIMRPSLHRAQSDVPEISGSTWQEKSRALKRLSLIKRGISVWAQEGRCMAHGNTFYLWFSETNISEERLDFCYLQDTFRRGATAKDLFKFYRIRHVQTLHWSRKVTNEISLIIQLLLRHQ